jgi:2-polyprenyl-6-methoxyphenol hydroxylase-like FAD-dependent oxidoreductase
VTSAREADSRLEVAIVGAGIGGLAAAIRLRQLGHRVTLLEQARQILPVGAGIQLAPNTTSRASRSNRQLFHLPDGPEQQERDDALANLSGDFDSYAWIWDDGTRRET